GDARSSGKRLGPSESAKSKTSLRGSERAEGDEAPDQHHRIGAPPPTHLAAQHTKGLRALVSELRVGGVFAPQGGAEDSAILCGRAGMGLARLRKRRDEGVGIAGDGLEPSGVMGWRRSRQQHVVAEEKLPSARRTVLPPVPPFTGLGSPFKSVGHRSRSTVRAWGQAALQDTAGAVRVACDSPTAKASREESDVGQSGKLAEQRVFGFKSFGAPGADVLWRADGGAECDEAMQLGGLAATPDLGPKVGDPGRRRPTVVVEDARLAQVSGYTYQTSHE
ncbi:unnamed protein product, partial [Symbiodinium sp. KB8]